MSLFGLIFISIIVFRLVRSMAGQEQGSRFGAESRNAGVIDRREQHSAAQMAGGTDGTGGILHWASSFRVTFQMEGGERKTFAVDRRTYDLLAEGDYGVLTFRGSTYLGFRRNGSIRES